MAFTGEEKMMRWGKRSSPVCSQCWSRSRPLRLETLENRNLLALIGVVPGFPAITFNSTGEQSYDASDQTFDEAATPLLFIPAAGEPPWAVSGNPNLEIHILVDHNGELIGGQSGDDLLVEGDIDINGDSVADFSGVLLTGEIREFGHKKTPSTVARFDFIFEVTGGQLAAQYYRRGQIGVTTTSENSSFQDDFTVSFEGGAKGTLGRFCKRHLKDNQVTVEEEGEKGEVEQANGRLNGRVMTSSERAISDVEITLTGQDELGNEIFRTTKTDRKGRYRFVDLPAGTYTISEVQPDGYVDGANQLGTLGGELQDDLFAEIYLGWQDRGKGYSFVETPL